MKKIITAIAAILFTAMQSDAQVNLGFKAGANLVNQRINLEEGNILSGDNLKGLHAGVIADMKITGHLYLQPQLIYTRRGAQHTNLSGAPDAKIKLHYLEIPVNLVYKIDVAAGKIFFGTGLTYSYALSGRQITADKSTSFFSDPDWKREDLNLNFTTGFQFNNGLYLSLNSEKGMLDINRSNSINAKNKSMSVSIGYFINRK